MLRWAANIEEACERYLTIRGYINARVFRSSSFRPARTRNLQSQYHLFQHQYQHAFLLLLQLLQHIWLQQLRLLLLRREYQ